jgi:hypothetical protein
VSETAHRHRWKPLEREDFCHYYWLRLACSDSACAATKSVRVERALNPDADYFDYLFARPDSCPRCAQLLQTEGTKEAG